VARWTDLEAAAPELAAGVRGRMDARRHKVLSTLRRDGSPRVTGIEAFFVDGDLFFGSMGAARKAQDLQRDGRFALHSGTTDPPDWTGDGASPGVLSR
jgi:hypothetical protein